MNETHTFIYDNVKEIYPDIAHDKTAVLRKAIRNYRAGKGVSLSFDAFKHLDDNKVYEFSKFERPRYLESKELVVFDKMSETPYYVGRKEIYVSDPVHAFSFEMSNNFDEFVNFLRAGM